MISVNNDFKTRTKKIKQQNIKLSIVDGELTVKEVHFMTVKEFNRLPVWMLRKRQDVIAKELKYSFEGNLFKTIMKQIEITVKNAGELKDKNVNFQYGIYVNNDFEYIDLGDYYIKDVDDDKGKTELVVTGYDKMIHFMKTFKQSELQLTYPCTMLKLIQKMCEVCGVELYSTDFFNADLQVDEDYFTAQELTYRDVLEKVAESTETTIFIKDNKLYLHKLANSPVEKLDASYLTGLTVKEKFGPVNALVLGRGDVEDNVEAKDDASIAQNGRCEIRFDENEFVEYKREQIVDEMFEQIKGIEYYAFEGSDVGVMWLEPCDLFEVEDNEESTYKTIYLKANITINTGISSDIEADIPEETNTKYKVTSKEEKKNLKVERLAKKNEGLIQDLIEENTETSQKLTEVEQTVDGIAQTVSNVETKVEQVEDKADSAQSTANTANQNAQNAQNTANNTNNNLSQNYYTKTETNSQINQKANEITSTVSQTYSTKTETTNAKNEAISSANSTTDKKLENYSTTTEMNSAINQKADEINTEVNKKVGEDELGTKITQNYESVQIAWNKISEFIQFINAQLQIKNDSKNLLMALDKLGMHFYDSTGKQIGDIGLIESESEKQIAFAINGDNIGNSMVWGIKKTSNGKTTFFPVFRYGDYNTQEGTGYGGLFTLEAPMVMQENTIFLGNGTDENSPQIFGTELDGNTGYVTIKTENGFEVRNSTGDIILSINLGYFKFGEIIETGTNIYGEYVVNVLGNVIADNLAQCQDISILSGGFYGNQDGYLQVHEKNGSNYFFLEADTVSDKKVKKNIKASKLNALEVIKKIKHKEYEWRNGNKEKVQVGYIAQELEKIDSNLVNVHEIKTDSGMVKDYTLNRTNILSLATKAIQEQQEQIEKQQNEIEKLKDIVNKQQEQINKLLQGTY